MDKNEKLEEVIVDPIDIVEAVMLYWWNTDKNDIFDDAYDASERWVADSYRMEKIDIMNQGFCKFWSVIDDITKARLVQAAVRRHLRKVIKSREFYSNSMPQAH